ncbi:MAG: hypothetical protein ACP6IS_12370 [Candidatus Asgardarchaeia archaeon]
MKNVDFSSDEVIAKNIEEHYSDLPQSLRDFVIFASPIEIGFEISKDISISLTFGEGFKGYLILKKENEKELRLAFTNTFFGQIKNIPAIDVVEVIFESGIPKKRYVRLYLRDLTNKLVFSSVINALKEKKLKEFLDTITLYGKKPLGTSLTQLDEEEKDFAKELTEKITADLEKALSDTSIPINEFLEYIIKKRKDEIPIVTELFYAFIEALIDKEKEA